MSLLTNARALQRTCSNLYPALYSDFKKTLHITNTSTWKGQHGKGTVLAPGILLNTLGLKNKLERSKEFSDITMSDGYDTADISLTLGGDNIVSYHSIRNQLKKVGNERLGVLWINGESELSTRDNTFTGTNNGMTVARLLGLCGVKPDFPPLFTSNMAYIGCRGINDTEQRLINDMEIFNISTKDVKLHGIVRVITNALHYQLANCNHIHVALNVNVIDPVVFPATGTTVANGLRLHHIYDMLATLRVDNRVKSFDFLGYNPEFDDEALTCGKNCIRLILSGITSNHI